jgi:ABC-2 type transport system ATP-binding protein
MKESPAPNLAVNNLCKSFGKKRIFHNLHFSFKIGAIALAGQNGVGKSTLMSLLAGIVAPDSGSIEIAGSKLAQSPLQAKAQMAFVPDEPVAYAFMSGFEYLMMLCALKRLPGSAIDQNLLAQFEIDTVLHQRFEKMSLGTQRKFMLAGGLIGDPLVLLMDEPSNGLDFKAKALLASIIRTRGADKLVFFSSHDQSLINDCGAHVFSLAPHHDALATESTLFPALAGMTIQAPDLKSVAT